jgi:hypothetical protein
MQLWKCKCGIWVTSEKYRVVRINSNYLLRQYSDSLRDWTVRGSNAGGREFPHPSRPALGPTQPPIQWVPGLLPRGQSGRDVALTTHPPSSAEVEARAELYICSPSGFSWTVLGWPLTSHSQTTQSKFLFASFRDLDQFFNLRHLTNCTYVWHVQQSRDISQSSGFPVHLINLAVTMSLREHLPK